MVQKARHSGPGWLEYDYVFCQHAALSTNTVLNELNPSLLTSTVLYCRTDPGQACSICHEPDHFASTCTIQALQPQHRPTPAPPAIPQPLFGNLSGAAMSAGGPIRPPCPETLECMCFPEVLMLLCLRMQIMPHLCHRRGIKPKTVTLIQATSSPQVPCPRLASAVLQPR